MDGPKSNKYYNNIIGLYEHNYTGTTWHNYWQETTQYEDHNAHNYYAIQLFWELKRKQEVFLKKDWRSLERR